ncbi:hypothetical protein LL946_05370 [Knoellia locipacati]|uniref:hypothetical protein n=1 Tax=Knoellia locipacati TaxID=882824 RepID=UPI0038507DAC
MSTGTLGNPTTQRRWPAYVMAVLSLGYALGKAVYAAQGRMGFPTGPVVSPEEHERYAREVMDVSLSQWLGCATGVLGAAISMATITRAGRLLPRTLVLVALAGMVLGVGAGAAVVVVDGFVGIGVGWRWFHGVVGLATLGALVLTTHSYVPSTDSRRRGARQPQ